MNGLEVSRFFNILRNYAYKTEKSCIESELLSNEEYGITTSLSKVQFDELYTDCNYYFGGKVRHKINKKDLLMFLCKLRQGLSDEFLKVIFKYSRRQSLSDHASLVRKSLMKKFVSENIGFQSITRQQ